MSDAVDLIGSLLMMMLGFVLAVVGDVDAFLGSAMGSMGLQPGVQVMVLGVISIFLMVYAVRLLGGTFGLLTMVLVVLLLLGEVLPHMMSVRR